MRVLINGVFTLKAKTGVGHTAVNLHAALAERFPDDAFWLYPGDAIGRVVRNRTPRPPSLRRKGGNDQSPSPHGRGAWGGVGKPLAHALHRGAFRVAARWGRFDLYHEPNFVPVRTQLPTVVTVHDLSVLLHPEWHPADRVRFHERHFRRGLAEVSHVVVVSESVRREMIEFLGIAPALVTAIPNGIGDNYLPHPSESVDAMRSRLGLPPRYLLAVGTIEPRKNIGTLLRAFADLPQSLREKCPLVLAGGWGWKSEPERELVHVLTGRGVIHLGYVADDDLPALYAGAAALFYPSYYEGFGLPPVEMLACGGAVVASTAAAVREVVGRHAVLIDPHDLAGWREAMKRTVVEPDWLDAPRRGGIEHARQFSWAAAAERTFAVYQAVLGRATPARHLVRSAAA